MVMVVVVETGGAGRETNGAGETGLNPMGAKGLRKSLGG